MFNRDKVGEEIFKMTTKTWILIGIAGVAIAAVGLFGWHEFNRSPYPGWIVSSNGRLEAQQVDITSKLPGRITEVLAEEGQMVDAGAILARLDRGANASSRGASASRRAGDQ